MTNEVDFLNRFKPVVGISGSSAAGDFTVTTSFQHIELGFRPTKVYICGRSSNIVIYYVLDEELNISERCYKGSTVNVTSPTSDHLYVDDTGFYFKTYEGFTTPTYTYYFLASK